MSRRQTKRISVLIEKGIPNISINNKSNATETTKINVVYYSHEYMALINKLLGLEDYSFNRGKETALSSFALDHKHTKNSFRSMFTFSDDKGIRYCVKTL